MLRGGRRHPFNNEVLPLIERHLRLAAWAGLGFVPLLLLLPQIGLPDRVLGAAAVVCGVLALILDDIGWGRSVALTSRSDVPASERVALGRARLLGERR